MKLVAVGPASAGALAELKAATFRETYAAANRQAEVDQHVARAFAVDAISRALADPLSTQLWVLDDDRPVGYVKLNVGEAQTEAGLDAGVEIEQIYARRSDQGRGIGRMLLDAARQFAASQSKSFVWLGVWEHNTAAIAFYEHHGYEVFGDHEFRFGDEVERDLLMRLWL